MGSMPDFSAFHHINNIVVMAPEIFISIFKTAIVRSQKRLTAGETPEPVGVG
jgi:hypothetical protein